MNLDDCFRHGFLKRIEPDMKNALRSLDSSEKCLSDARKNLDIGCYNVVVIVSYTAMFHAARALLFKDGVKERSHLCIPVYIREKYPDFNRFASILDSYRIFRHRAIYGLETVIDKADAEEALCSASEFLKAIRGLVKDAG
jgi:uncharacterized protein (UPF0332 family)